MPRLRLCSPLWVGAAVLAGLCAGVQAAELSAEERLEAVRQALVQQALGGATQVQSTAWIDPQGALRESSSFRHGMQVRGVRVLAYQRDEAGRPQAQLQLQGAQDLLHPPAPLPALPAEAARCEPPQPLRHLVGWRLDTPGRWPVDEQPLAQALAQQLAQGLRQAAGSARAWRLLEVPQPPALASAPSTATAYERLLTGGPGAQPAGWLLNLRLEPLPPLPPSPPEPLFTREQRPSRARVSLLLQPAEGGPPLFQAQAELPVQAQTAAWAPPRLAPASLVQLEGLLDPWLRTLGERLACQPVRVQVLQAQAGRVQVDQGALAGLHLGQEWLIADRQKVPQHLLEPGAAARLVLARVDSLSPQRAELQVLAGESGQVRPRWLAWPLHTP